MSDNSLTELHNVEKELLLAALEIFEKYDINYYAIGGTLLGAVRHGGFIPWDDDIDIAVPREDYVRLIDVMHEIMRDVGDSHVNRLAENDVEEDADAVRFAEIVGMKYYRDDPSLYYYPVRLVHKGYLVNDPREHGLTHPWIDILPIDGWPKGKIRGRIFKLKMLYCRLMLGFHYSDNLRDKKRSGLEKLLIGFARLTRIGRHIDPTKYKDKIDKTLSSAKADECDVVGTCMGAYFFHEYVPKAYFGKGSSVTFEGISLNAPEQVDRYLTHMYGADYMDMPPAEVRVVHVDGVVVPVEFE